MRLPVSTLPSGDRPAYPSDERLTSPRAERRAVPSRPAIPPGDRPTYPSAEGQT